MKNRISRKELLSNISCMFFMSLSFLSIIGFISEGKADDSIMFMEQGLPYTTIFQFLLFSVIAGIFVTYITREDKLIHTPFSKRVAYIVAVIYILTIAFIILFQWFEVDDVVGWIIFTVLYFLGFLVSFCIFRYLFRYEEKRYEQLLLAYRKRRNGE